MPFDRFIQYFRKLYKFIIFTFKTCNAGIPYSTTLVWLLECHSCRFFLIRIVIRTAVETIICLSFRNTFRCFILGGYMTPFTSVFIMYWYVTMFYFHWINQIKLKKTVGNNLLRNTTSGSKLFSGKMPWHLMQHEDYYGPTCEFLQFLDGSGLIHSFLLRR